MDKVITVDNLTFEYTRGENEEPVRALDGVSFEIDKGSFTAIIGKNGSGKSTLAKNLNGLLVPTSGTVFVEGYDTRDDEVIWEIRQRAGMVFQNPDNQLVSSIVEDDVAFGPENLGIDPAEIRQRVDKALEDVNMGEYKMKAPHLLSGGQKQRIAIAGVVAMRPEIIIFDEPTAMLDPKGRKEIMAIIKELHRDGKTVILITHFMEEAIEADRVIILDQGRILLDGDPEEVFERADEIRAVNLEIPMVTDLADRLIGEGIEVPKGIIREDDLVDAICRLKSQN
ncbi:MAG: energy-coupling factor transporter ATPase [Firmicutes bacterium]|nr:energy-coupling factor transporter ATPase [Bacillota bacterium]